jgi:hypothetical protein
MSAPKPLSSSCADADDQVAEAALTRLVRALARQAARQEFRARSEGDVVNPDNESPAADSNPQFNSEAPGQ